jgi:hypothetical protein
MSHSKPISKAKGRRKAVTALGVAGALSLAGGASASIATGGIPPQNTAPVILAEELWRTRLRRLRLRRL